jgi:hypothetical protein
MNTDHLIERFLNSRTTIIIVGSLILFGMNLYLGYCLAPEQELKSIICNNEINQVEILNEQVDELRKDSISSKIRVQKECMEQQQTQCTKKIGRYKNACLELKCEICKAKR